MESLTMAGGMGGAMGSLKGSLQTQKNAVGELLEGGKQTATEIAKSGMDAARNNQMQQMGIGQKLNISA